MATEHAIAEQLRRRMLTDISSGSLPPGARLGSERQLAEHYGVSRGTLRQVLSKFEESGLVHRVAGRSGGTFITHGKVEHNLSKVVGVPAYLARQGYAAGTRVVSTRMEVAAALTQRALQLSAGSLVLDIRRLRLADGRPFSLDQARMPAERFPGLLEMSLGGSIYELLESEFDVVPADAEEIIEVVHATGEEAALLSVTEGDALLGVTRTTYDKKGDPFEFSHDLFRSDRTQIVMRTHGHGLLSIPIDNTHFARIFSVPGTG